MSSANTKQGQTAEYTGTCLDHASRTILSKGLDHFHVVDDGGPFLWPQHEDGTMIDGDLPDSAELAELPRIGFLCDRAAPGGMLLGLLVTKLRARAFYDPLHDEWNQCQIGIQHSSLYSAPCVSIYPWCGRSMVGLVLSLAGLGVRLGLGIKWDRGWVVLCSVCFTPFTVFPNPNSPPANPAHPAQPLIVTTVCACVVLWAQPSDARYAAQAVGNLQRHGWAGSYAIVPRCQLFA
jgi:hypothetical protein